MKTEQVAVGAVEKKELKKYKRHSRNKILLRVLAGLLAVILVFVGVTATLTIVGLKLNIKKAKEYPSSGTQQLELENYANGYWNIKSDKGLKVMQLTDVHLGGGWMSLGKDKLSINAVASMIIAEKPDFVMVTGDVAYPVPFQAGTFNNKNGAKLFAELMEQLGVYWTIAFGNHDTEAYSFYSREKILDFYSSDCYPHCLLQAGPQDVDGVGNQVFNVVNSDGVVIRTLFVMDSHSYIDGDYFGIFWKYDNIHENQISWYKKTLQELATKNEQTVNGLSPEKAKQYAKFTEVVPSSVYQHIPLTEYKVAWNEYITNGEKNTDDVKYIYGVAGENKAVVYCGIHDDYMFETMLELGSTDSVFCGHDHLNNFSIEYKGIRLTYGMSVDYLAYPGIYKLGSQRGCTLIEYTADGSFSSFPSSLYQSKYTSLFVTEDVTMQEITNQKEVL